MFQYLSTLGYIHVIDSLSGHDKIENVMFNFLSGFLISDILQVPEDIGQMAVQIDDTSLQLPLTILQFMYAEKFPEMVLLYGWQICVETV